ncbi:hypothetical protein EV1_021142 [Malus domestica]
MADRKLFILAPKGGGFSSEYHCTNVTTSNTRTSLPNSIKWSELQPELSELILKILDSTNFVDVHCFKAVCTSCKVIYLCSCGVGVASSIPMAEAPWPRRGTSSTTDQFCIFSLAEKGLHDEECV